MFDESNQPIDEPRQGEKGIAAPTEEPRAYPPPGEAAAAEQAAEQAGVAPPAEIPSGDLSEDGGLQDPVEEARAKELATEKAATDVAASVATPADTGPETPAEVPAALDTAVETPEEAKSDKMDWYILKVQSNREESIREGLLRRVAIAGLERYFGDVIVPTEKVTEFKGGKKKVTRRKLYPGYLVVHMEINDDTWFLVRETPGIGDFTGAAGMPTPMLEHEVSRILAKAEEKTDEAPKLKIAFSQGDRVKINDGTFQNFEGEVEHIDQTNGRVTVMINIFGRSTPVELEYWQIESIS